MDKRYYKKKGPTFRERIRCPLCGTLRRIGYFSLDHLFGVYRYRYAGKGDISVTLAEKDPTFMSILRADMAKRMLDLLEQFTAMKWFSQDEVNEIVAEHERMIAVQTLSHVPHGVPIPRTVPQGTRAHNTSRGIRSRNVVIEYEREKEK